MINLEGNDVLLIADAAKEIPARSGHGVHVATIHRWMRRGLKVGKQRVRLESFKIGGSRATTRQALARFFVQLSAGAADMPGELPPDSRRTKRTERAALRLDQLGIV